MHLGHGAPPSRGGFLHGRAAATWSAWRVASALAVVVALGCAKTPPSGPSLGAAGPSPAASSAAAAPPPGGSGAAAPSPSASVSVAPPPGQSAATRGPYNVLLVSIDSLRADMPWVSYPRPIAPRLTELHKRAVSYRSGYSISSLTSKSVAGLLGGKYPSEMARTYPFFTKYHPENKMFCEALAEQSIPCVAGHGHAYFMKGLSGFDQGFREWRLVPGIQFDAETDRSITSDKLTPIAIELLSDPKLTGTGAGGTAGAPTPFFAWFHFMDPHDQYKPHPEAPRFGNMSTNRDLYDQEVFFTDMWVGKLLDFVEKQPWAKNTVVVVTADHGEAFMDHNLVRHAIELYEVLVHVPLFFVIPGQPARTIDTPRSHVDLAPTILDLLGAKPDPAFRGVSLTGELFGGPAPPRDVICDLPKDEFNQRRRSLLHDGWKIIAFMDDVRFELYDLRSDPDEKIDLFAKNKERAADMLARYKEASRSIRDVPAR